MRLPTDAETTQPLPAVPPAPPAVPGQPEHLTVGLPLLDLLAPQQTGPASQGPPPYPPQGVPHQAGHYGVPYQAPPVRPQRLRRPGVRLVAGLAVAVLALAVFGIWALQSPPTQPAGRSNTATAPTTAIRVAGGYQFTQSAARSDADCAANSYGKTSEFFTATPCTGMDRTLYTSTIDGRRTVISVAVVRMATEQNATELKKLVDTTGTGNVSDLLRAGVQVPGGPQSFTDAGYASARDGSAVVIVEADFADPAVNDDAALEKISTAALQLRR